MNIRQAKESDLTSIIDFQIAMAWETEKYPLDKNTVTQGVQSMFADNSKGYYYVAEEEGEVIGSLLTLYEWSDWRNGNVIWVHSVFIKKEYRGKGVFKAMYSTVKSLVEEDEGLKGIRLYVDKTNQKAQKVYEAIGMTKEHYEMYEWMK